MERILKIVALLAVVVVFLGIAGAAYWMRVSMPFLSPGAVFPMGAPSQGFISAPPPQVMIGSGYLTKTNPFDDASLSTEGVMDIEATAEGYVVAGTTGAAILDRNFHLQSSAKYAVRPDYSIEILDADTGNPQFLISDTERQGDVVILDKAGAEIWRCTVEEPIRALTAADFDGDGKREVVAGLRGAGVLLLDQSCNVRWRHRDRSVFAIVQLDTTGDGKPEIVYSTSQRATVLDAQGKQIATIKGGGAKQGDFTLCRWPDKDGPLCLLAPTSNGAEILDTSSKILMHFPAPYIDESSTLQGTPVVLEPEKPAFFAMISDSDTLHVYDQSSVLVYMEVADTPLTSILAVPDGDSGREALLVGGDKLYRYSLAVPAILPAEKVE